MRHMGVVSGISLAFHRLFCRVNLVLNIVHSSLLVAIVPHVSQHEHKIDVIDLMHIGSPIVNNSSVYVIQKHV